MDTGCQGIVADAWPGYYSPTGDIEAGVDHPFDFPGEAREDQGRRDPGLLTMEPLDSRRRDLLRGATALLADALLPRHAFPAADPGPDPRAIVVTFGGGVRWEDTFAPEGWTNIPHLVADLVPQGLFFPEARYDGLTGHFNATGALVTGCLQNVDAYGGEAPTTPTVFECFRKERGLPAGSGLGGGEQQELRPARAEASFATGAIPARRT